MIVLNMMPFNFITRIFFILSALFSLFYFCLAIYEIGKIIFNHFYPSSDWGIANKDKKELHNSYLNILLIYVIVYFIIVILLVIVFPVFHI